MSLRKVANVAGLLQLLIAVAMFVLNWQLALVVLAIVPPLALISVLLSNRPGMVSNAVIAFVVVGSFITGASSLLL